MARACRDDLWWAKTGIFLQAGLDRQISDLPSDLPVRLIASLKQHRLTDLEPDDFTLVHSLSFGNSLRIRLE